MTMQTRPTSRRSAFLATTALLMATALPAFAQDEITLDDSLSDMETYVTEDGEVIMLDAITVQAASDELKQSLGTSVITADDLESRPVTNDVSEAVRRMPGVNLTGASATGQRGNQRQIDIRGMGPENTLILVDGKPVLSRNSVKMGRGGERDTRGDSNWVPAEMVERIEVIRGPAAARYGSGAAGGVVNIITKVPEEETFTFSLFYEQPESDLEGANGRTNFLWAKPLGDNLSFRLIGNYNKSDGDDPSLNASSVEEGDTILAGNEGVVNKDVSTLLRWDVDDFNRIDFELGYSRQSNIYAGDTQLGSTDELTEGLADEGAETNIMQRTTAAITHTGDYAFGELTSYLQYEHSDNNRLSEGASGGGEGRINSTEDWTTTLLDNVTAKSELDIDGSFMGHETVWTLGGEVRYERMNNTDLITSRGDIDFDYGDTSASAADRDPISSQTIIGLYGEANILYGDATTITPAFRVDYADTFGMNVSGGLNASVDVSPSWKIKTGYAAAFKAPNLYQLNPNYIYTTRGNGCPYPYNGDGPCYVLGNEDLDPETSLNFELGTAYDGPNGLSGTLTYFHNDYRDKIQSGTEQLAYITVGADQYRVYQWVNIPEAEVSGLEGNINYIVSSSVSFNANFTYMITSKNKQTGDPLSLVPEYTINASVNWDVNDKLTLIPSVVHYGEIDAASTNAATGYAYDDTDSRDPYTLVNFGGTYDVNEDFAVNFGVKNVFDTSVLRSGDGANTFNEPGRSYYVGLTKTF
ncbi:FepA family TonB-dependent siderophore receptor [Pseudooceanicola algae]|uniref:Ferric enterobactin receptor n=1 Tax=Pseudooceanicola algae TaxID=1537215 RepID=A0A418SJE8_9RHOB|nr:FepA family TonB-dependent siderophore receptor [Pseudooceanicola algae]QPM91856.1 Ferric enterobactin receptor [Pseudooceanicola algae]